MSATFVTDIATVVGLTILFVKPTIWIVPFALVSVAMIVGLPKLSPWFFTRFGDRVIEPEIKLVFACLLCLMWLGSRANSQAALPAFVLGLVMSSHYVQHRPSGTGSGRPLAFLTPFFSQGRDECRDKRPLGEPRRARGAVHREDGAEARWRLPARAPLLPPHATFTTLLISTGLTFGTITSLYGLSAHIIDRTQFSLLISVVVLSAVVPTAIAQRFYAPSSAEQRDLTAPVAPATVPALHADAD